MQLSFSFATVAALYLISSPPVAAALSWSFSDATLFVQGKGQGVGGGLKEKLYENKPLARAVELGPSDTLRIILTTQEEKTAKRPHQAFLEMRDASSGLETSFPLAVRETGKGKVELTHKDIPTQLLASTNHLSMFLIVASFGTSTPYDGHVFDLAIKRDPTAPAPTVEKPLRYMKQPEIHHIFKPDPKSPPKIISLFFTAIVLATLPGLFIVWMALGANLNHISKAFGSSPVAHALFFGSVLAMEGIFFMYYTSWNLFQTLPPAMAVGTLTFLSGSRALSEVQERRLVGLR